MNYEQLAEEIIEKMGGASNISQSWHCITRLRFNVLDEKKVHLEEIQELPGVLGAQFQSGQFQVIIGNEVAKVFAEVQKKLGDQTAQAPAETKQKKKILDVIFDTISGIFTPILPAITASGLLKGFLALALIFHWLTEQSSEYQILNAIGDAPFYFLPFLVAFSASKKFNVNQFVGATVAGILMYPTILNTATGGEITSMKFFFLTIPMKDYSSSVVPVILSIWLLSYVYKWVEKFVPKVVSFIFVPLLSLLITAPLVLAFVAPLGNYIGIYVEEFFSGLFHIAGPIAGLLMGALMPVIVMTGMHYAFFPSTFASFDKVGYDIMLLPMNLVSNFAQAAATLGVAVKSKNKKLKSMAYSTFISAVFGITEPAMYGITLKLKKPFYAALIGGGVGGAIFGSLNVKAFSFSIPGITALPSYVEKGTNNFLYALIGIAASIVVAFVITVIWYKDVEMEENLKTNQASTQPRTTASESSGALKQPFAVVSPMSGHVVPLSEVPDTTFSDEMVGKGAAVIPTEGVVLSPFSGKVYMIPETKHAIGLLSDEGVELLIHIGLDTVELQGKYFEVLVEENQPIEKGEPLLNFDIDQMAAEGIQLMSPVVVTNSAQYLDLLTAEVADVKANEDVLFTIIP